MRPAQTSSRPQHRKNKHIFNHWKLLKLNGHAAPGSCTNGIIILVPRAHDPSGLWQGSRALAWSNTGSPRFTDFSSNLIGREHETNALRILRKSGPARALEPCHRPEGSWALGTRMRNHQMQHVREYTGHAHRLLCCHLTPVLC